MMSEENLEKLARSIKRDGQIVTAWKTPDGQILDGRNRMLANKRLGVETRFEVYEGDDPVAFVTSCNIRRRHLAIEERRVLVVKLKALYEAEAKKRQGQKGATPATTENDADPATTAGRVNEKIAKATGTSPRTVANDLRAAGASKPIKQKEKALPKSKPTMPLDPWLKLHPSQDTQELRKFQQSVEALGYQVILKG